MILLLESTEVLTLSSTKNSTLGLINTKSNFFRAFSFFSRKQARQWNFLLDVFIKFAVLPEKGNHFTKETSQVYLDLSR